MSTVAAPSEALVRDCVNTIRTLAIDATNAANSGHPGAPMGLADLAFVLMTDALRFNPHDPAWPGRDRFVLSNGHASMLLYAMLHLTGYDLPLEQIKQFRQWGSMTPGHPEYHCAPGVEITTGPLGSGFASAVGMALGVHMAEARFATPEFNPVDHYIIGIAGDGCLMEGVSHEAASYAGHLGLGRLIFFYDSNHISIDGSTEITFTDDTAQRFEAYGWHVQHIDGMNHDEVRAALAAAKAETQRPSLIVARTIIGYPSPKVAGTAAAHGSPLGEEEAIETKKVLGWPTDEPFRVPDDVRAYFDSLTPRRVEQYDAWQRDFAAWREANPSLAQLWDQAWDKTLPDGLQEAMIAAVGTDKAATRALSGKVIQAVAGAVNDFIGGSADLTGSTSTLIKDARGVGVDANVSNDDRFRGRNFHYGVREFGMGCVVNGLTLYGCWRAFGATFLVFSDYMRPSIRLAALMEIPSMFVFTHDSIYLGEDGPTHQPIEHLSALRSIPNLNVLRPADGLETALCWWYALTQPETPSCLVLTRQGLPPLGRPDGFQPADVLRGGYTVAEQADPDVILVATGSEVTTALDAAQRLAEAGTKARVVSMPCVEAFERQDTAYQEQLFPHGVPLCAVEAGRSRDWQWLVGRDGLVIGIDRFGASAPGPKVGAEFGFTGEAIAARVRTWLPSA